MMPSARQSSRLWLASLFSLSVRALPSLLSSAAGRGAVLAPALAFAAAVPTFGALTRVMRRRGLSLADASSFLLGKGVLFFAVPASVLLAAAAGTQCRYFTERIGTLLPDVPEAALTLLFLSVGSLTVSLGRETGARAGEVLLFPVVAAFLAAAALCLSRPDAFSLVPSLSEAARAPAAAVPAFGFFASGTCALLLTQNSPDVRRRFLRVSALLAFLMTVAVCAVLNVLGPALPAETPYPFVTAIRSADVFNGFERVESFITSIAIVSDVLFFTLTAHSFRLVTHLPVPVFAAAAALFTVLPPAGGAVALTAAVFVTLFAAVLTLADKKKPLA